MTEIGHFRTGPNGRPQFADSNEQSFLTEERGLISDRREMDNNGMPLRPDDMDFMLMEQSQDEISVQEQHKKELLSSYAIGFERKLIHLQNHQLKQSKINASNHNIFESSIHGQGGARIDVSKIETLDAKAQAYSPQKGLHQYEKKGPEVSFRLDEGRPIRFFNSNSQNEYQLADEVIEELSKCSGHISFVSISGQPHSGKTFLMNSIVEAQTNTNNDQKFLQEEGVIMWSQPLYNTLNSSWVFFIDTCLNLERQDHIQLHFIVQLISSATFVNTVGALTNESLNSFQSLLRMRDIVKLETEEEITTAINLSPSLILLLRDFSFEEFEGKKTSVSQIKYFEDFLFDEISYLKDSKEMKKIKQRILKYYKQRSLVAINCPVDNKADLVKLQNLDSAHLSENFNRDLYFVRKTILNSTPLKEYKGVYFNATMFNSFINSLLEDMRNKEKLDISKAFNVLLQNEFLLEYNECIELYFQILGQEFNNEQFKSIEGLQTSLLTARETATERFYNLRAHDSPEAQEKFQTFYNYLVDVFKKKEDDLIKSNNENTTLFMEAHLISLSQGNKFSFKPASKQQKFSVNDVDRMEKEFAEETTIINRQLLGQGNQYGLIGNIAQKIQKLLINSISKEIEELEINHAYSVKSETEDMNNLKEQIAKTEKEKKQILERRVTITNETKEIQKVNEASKQKAIQLNKEIEAAIKEKERLAAEQQAAKKKASTKCGCMANDLSKYEQRPNTQPAQGIQQGRIQN